MNQVYHFIIQLQSKSGINQEIQTTYNENMYEQRLCPVKAVCVNGSFLCNLTSPLKVHAHRSL